MTARVLLAVTLVGGWWYAGWLAGPHPSAMVRHVVAPPGVSPAPGESAAPVEGRAPAPPRLVPPAARAGREALEELEGRDLTLPVQGVRLADLVPSFHDARGSRTHEAIDIMAPKGTPVVAVEDGIIAKAFTSERGGLTLYQFDPSGRFCYYYAHLDGYAPGVIEGLPVKRGQVIGYVGSTGNADPSAPHLHFAVFELGPEREWWKGTPVDPFLVWR